MSRRIERPILGVDVIGVLPFLLDIPIGPTAHTRAEVLRRAELLRRFYPAEALALLESLPKGEDPSSPLLQPAVIRAHALLESGDWSSASLELPDLPEAAGVRDLVTGRVHIGRGDLEPAEQRLSLAIAAAQVSDEPLAPEVLAEGLSLRGRLRVGSGQREAGLEDLEALEALCAEHDALLTRASITVLRGATEQDKVGALSHKIAAVSRRLEEARYAQPHEERRFDIAPIPLHVHGAMVEHQDAPAEYVKAILQLSALAWRVGDRVAGLETAFYGQRIGARRFGDAAVADLSVYLQALEQREGAEAWGALLDALRARAQKAHEARVAGASANQSP